MGTSFNLFDSIVQHLELTIISLLISTIIGIILGIILYKSKYSSKFLSIISAIQTIPTLALLGFLVPILGIGKVPAIFVLIIYGCYPIIVNTFSGISQIDPEYIEISEALGMSSQQQLFKVRLPLSIPIIMTGIRTGLVQIIGVATLTSLIGAGGLGDFIYRGINSMNNSLILQGAIPTVIIVTIFVAILKFIEKHWIYIYSKKKILSLISVLVIISYIIVNCFSFGQTKQITLASKDFTESGILTTIMAELIENNTDIEVNKKMYIGTTDILHKALINHEIDGYVEYTGTSYLTVFKQIENRNDLLQYVQKEYEKIGIKAFNSLGINNTFVILQSKDIEKKYNFKNISDLKPFNQFVLTSYAEFIEREDGLKSFEENYHLTFKDVKQLERSLGYKALAENQVDFMVSFSTEPAIYKYQFKALEDDQNTFLRYDAIPLISQQTLDKYPELVPLLGKLENKFDNNVMAKLNNDVENNHRKEVDVAREWLKEENLIK